MKLCIKCKIEKSHGEFSKNNKTQDKLTSWCKLCKKESDKQHYLKNKESINERIKQYRILYPEVSRLWRSKNKEKIQEKIKLYRLKHKRIVFNHYGICQCCGESNLGFLTIDHINNDGAQHRKEIFGKKTSGGPLYHWIIKNNFPQDLQSLCYNCNCGKQSSNLNLCPHKI